jgi:spoIIIJ-associated protein
MPVLDIEKLPSKLEEFLKPVLRAARLDLPFKIQTNAANPPHSETPDMMVEFSGADTDILLARGGELLEALEELSGRVLRIPIDDRAKLSFDCKNFRMLRAEELRLTAVTAAEMAVTGNAPFALNPMNSRDRRIVHLALKGNPAVRTESEGGGPYRKVVIFPAEKK